MTKTGNTQRKYSRKIKKQFVSRLQPPQLNPSSSHIQIVQGTSIACSTSLRTEHGVLNRGNKTHHRQEKTRNACEVSRILNSSVTESTSHPHLRIRCWIGQLQNSISANAKSNHQELLILVYNKKEVELVKPLQKNMRQTAKPPRKTKTNSPTIKYLSTMIINSSACRRTFHLR